MIALDLFAEFDDTAREYGWTGLGQPRDFVRRYGKTTGGLQVTVSVFANLAGTAIKGASRRTIVTLGEREGESNRRVLGTRDSGKRDRVLAWLRE